MHGMMMDELKKYVSAKVGESVWTQITNKAVGRPKIYFAHLNYSDEETSQIISTISSALKRQREDWLFDFGAFITPDLIKLCKDLIGPTWRTLDFLEHTEQIIHDTIRKNWQVFPPILKCQRTSASEVLIEYSSPRKMCSVARGLAQGVATHYGETIQILEPSCMLQGAAKCLIAVRSA